MYKIFESSEDAAEALADLIVSRINEKPSIVLGLATGATMEPVYAALIAAHKAGRVSFAGVTSFNLDEYEGLSPRHSGSYRATMDHLLFDHVDIDKAKTHLPDGMTDDPEHEGERYERLIAEAGGIDLQLLGIGRNGHIGFNEPGSAFSSRTRLVVLEEETLKANAGFFSDRSVPERALTMGIATILDAREIAVMATGPAKADAVARALFAAPDTDCPASALNGHDNVRWFLDREAAAELPDVDVRLRAAD
jgi:glucosamine-6-phosphate deaminase